MAKTAGSPAFFAPELCGGDDFDFFDLLANNAVSSPAIKQQLKIGPQIDIWAIGVTLYCISFGKVPFIAPTELKLFKVICKQRFLVNSLNQPVLIFQMEQVSSSWIS